jgi:catechol 2,3-dioxygenase-like lactoylglutathione lyase family enzyme
MFGYSLVGSNDLVKAKSFYDDLLSLLGLQGVFEHPSGGRLYGVAGGPPIFGVLKPVNGEPATVGNGTMIAFKVETPEMIAEFYEKALALGGTDEGQPGIRGPAEYGFHAAYFRDLDGNKLCVYTYATAKPAA